VLTEEFVDFTRLPCAEQEIAVQIDDAIALGDELRRDIFDENYSKVHGSSKDLNGALRDQGSLYLATVWGRPGLDRRTRRAMTISILATNNHPRALSLHLQAALKKGDFTADELKEMMIHLSMYCGVPTATMANDVLSGVLKTEVVV
jgi:3-oxoadipate enol-lactonase / 4-carboxymuconolactone decarboxylase